jgi:hypothetical protein
VLNAEHIGAAISGTTNEANIDEARSQEKPAMSRSNACHGP